VSEVIDFNNSSLISPYGGSLVNLIAPSEALAELKDYASSLPSLQISERAACDIELLASGAFSPLDRFMGKADYQQVVHEMRLSSGYIFPIPITLPIEYRADLQLDCDIALRNSKNELLAVMKVEDIYEWDRAELARRVFGTEDLKHPLMAEMRSWGPYNLSGQLQVLHLPRHYDFQELRLTPAQTRGRLASLGRSNVVAFQTRNPLHRAHEELIKRAVEEKNGTLLLHPVVGLTKPGDVDHYCRVRTYKALVDRHLDAGSTLLALLPLAMRMAGPREALWHALIRRNYGANHLIVGRNHADPGLDSMGRPFYSPYEAQEIIERFSAELGVNAAPSSEVVYLPDEGRYEQISNLPAQTRIASISGTQVREMYLDRGRPLPEWFTRPEVAEILTETYPPRHRQGVCIWFTGLSGAGKSTTAEILLALMLEHGRPITLLDGDIVRTHLSQGLGFSKQDRDINVRRIGFVASEIVRHGGLVICSAISPYRAIRNDVRNLVGTGSFVEVFVDTPFEVCEERDAKGLYAKARLGEIKDFTGIDDPYEPPLCAEITLDTVNCAPEMNARRVLDYLIAQGFVRGQGTALSLTGVNGAAEFERFL